MGILTGATDQTIIISEPQRSKLYKRIRHLLGAPIRSVEIEDEMMDSLLELAIGDYSQYIQDWLIESQWTSLYNLNLDTESLTRAFVTKSLDWETRYTYAYSKIVGLQAGGDWELKKDYIVHLFVAQYDNNDQSSGESIRNSHSTDDFRKN